MVLFFLPYCIFAFAPFSSKPYLIITDTPDQSIYVNWNTVSQESTIVAYGTTLALEDTIRLTGEQYYHHIELTGLSPQQLYYYQVLPGGDIRHFTTFPQSAYTFNYIAFGDTRSDSVSHQSVINRMADYPFAFIMHTGDLVNDGNNEDDWTTYFNVEDTLIQDYHLLPVIGNHESPYWPYDTLFVLPDSEDYYSINYGLAHFIALNTETDLYGAQQNWLISDLQNANNDSTIHWIFVGLHRPPYSSGNHGSQMDVRNAWCSLFEQYNVDIVFCGHDHDYERTISINGVFYIVTGGGGAPLRHVGTSSWTAYSESTYHFCHVRVSGGHCKVRAIKPDGTVFDSLVISKTIGVQETGEYSDNGILIGPNPFSSEIHIRISGRTGQRVQSLEIYDATGRMVMDFPFTTDHSILPPVIIWDGTDNAGNRLPSGAYFLHIMYSDRIRIQAIILLQ
jgi:hypothetical protein